MGFQTPTPPTLPPAPQPTERSLNAIRLQVRQKSSGNQSTELGVLEGDFRRASGETRRLHQTEGETGAHGKGTEGIPGRVAGTGGRTVSRRATGGANQRSDRTASGKALLLGCGAEFFLSSFFNTLIFFSQTTFQNEIENLKQALADSEEKVQYQSDERLRDVNEVLENCQTRVSEW